MARRREVSLELDKLYGVPFERPSAQEDARSSELRKSLDRLDSDLSSFFLCGGRRGRGRSRFRSLPPAPGRCLGVA